MPSVKQTKLKETSSARQTIFKIHDVCCSHNRLFTMYCCSGPKMLVFHQRGDFNCLHLGYLALRESKSTSPSERDALIWYLLHLGHLVLTESKSSDVCTWYSQESKSSRPILAFVFPVLPHSYPPTGSALEGERGLFTS